MVYFPFNFHTHLQARYGILRDITALIVSGLSVRWFTQRSHILFPRNGLVNQLVFTLYGSPYSRALERCAPISSERFPLTRLSKWIRRLYTSSIAIPYSPPQLCDNVQIRTFEYGARAPIDSNNFKCLSFIPSVSQSAGSIDCNRLLRRNYTVIYIYIYIYIYIISRCNWCNWCDPDKALVYKLHSSEHHTDAAKALSQPSSCLELAQNSVSRKFFKYWDLSIQTARDIYLFDKILTFPHFLLPQQRITWDLHNPLNSIYWLHKDGNTRPCLDTNHQSAAEVSL
jgi:hypothetical protein